MRRTLVLAFVAVGLALASPASPQCSMCRTTLQSEEGRRTAAGLRQGIVLLLSAPFLLAGGIAWKVARLERGRTWAPSGDERPPDGEESSGGGAVV